MFVAKFVCMVAAALTLAATGGAANAQQKSLKEHLAGTWHFVIAEVTAPDGTKSFPFGPKLRGMEIFTPQGDFMQIHIAAEVPKIANANRLQATPEEYAGIMRGTIASSAPTRWTGEEAVHDEVHRVDVPELGGRVADAHDRRADGHGPRHRQLRVFR